MKTSIDTGPLFRTIYQQQSAGVISVTAGTSQIFSSDHTTAANVIPPWATAVRVHAVTGGAAKVRPQKEGVATATACDAGSMQIPLNVPEYVQLPITHSDDGARSLVLDIATTGTVLLTWVGF